VKGLTAPVASSVVNVLAFLFALASSAVPEDSSAPPPQTPPPAASHHADRAPATPYARTRLHLQPNLLVCC
jgi:hypothetical protein